MKVRQAPPELMQMISVVRAREHPEVELSPTAATVLCILLTDIIFTNTENPEGLLSTEAQRRLAGEEQSRASIEPGVVVTMRERRGIEGTPSGVALRFIGVLQAVLCTMLLVATQPETVSATEYSSSEEEVGYEWSDDDDATTAQDDGKARIKVTDLVRFRRDERLRPL